MSTNLYPPPGFLLYIVINQVRVNIIPINMTNTTPHFQSEDSVVCTFITFIFQLFFQFQFQVVPPPPVAVDVTSPPPEPPDGWMLVVPAEGPATAVVP